MSKVEMAKTFIEEWPLLDDEINHIDNMTYLNHYNLRKIRLAHRQSLQNNSTTTTEKPKSEQPKESNSDESVSKEL